MKNVLAKSWRSKFNILTLFKYFIICGADPGEAGMYNSTHGQLKPSTVRDSSYYIGAAFGLGCAVVGGFYTVILSGPHVKDLPSFMVIFYAASAGVIVALISVAFNPNQQLVAAGVIYIF